MFYFNNIYNIYRRNENKDNKKASFIDLGISIENKKIDVGLFDKRDAFNFTIVRMPSSDYLQTFSSLLFVRIYCA